ncbi:MAG: hypothetical protein E6G09_15425 [Actinobacteria bacterium]|nr:MAG: hypothetical protein E6G09_15425 [Actinomycetota bacterium]
MGVAALLTAAMLAATPASYVASHQQADGGFAETGSRSTPGLTAWAMLGLRTAGQPTGKAHDFLVANEAGVGDPRLRSDGASLQAARVLSPS